MMRKLSTFLIAVALSLSELRRAPRGPLQGDFGRQIGRGSGRRGSPPGLAQEHAKRERPRLPWRDQGCCWTIACESFLGLVSHLQKHLFDVGELQLLLAPSLVGAQRT